MLKVVSRKEALGMIDSIFTSFHFGLMSITDSGIENSWEREYFWTEANKVDQGRLTKEYEQTVSSLDAQGFNAYYKFIGEFAARYKIGCWEEYNQYEPIVIEELNDELGKHAKTEEKLELIDSFTVDELQSDSFIFDSKVQVLYDILDDSRVKDNKEKCINKVLSCFNSNDKAGFISKIQSDRHLLDALVDKVNGTEKDEMLALLGEMFISSGFIKDQKAVLLNNNKTDRVTATFKKGNINIDVKSPVPGGARDYATTKSKSITASPFDLIGLNYDGREIKVPALLLLNSWSNSAATPEGIFFNYKDEDIDWSKLSDEEKDKYFFDYVKHYLPSGFFAAIGNPVHLIAVSLISACFAILTGGTGAMAQLSIALSGAGIVMSGIDCGFAVRDIVNVGKLKDESQTVHEVKQAAKLMAKHIARLTLNGIDIICNFVDIVKSGTIIQTEKKQIQSKELILSAEKKLHANINEKPLAAEEILAKIASGEEPPEILVKISTGSSEKYRTIAQAQKEYCFVCDYEELRGLSNKDIQKKLGFETFNDIDLYATFIIPPKNVKAERVTFDSLKNDVRKKLLVDEKFSDNIKGIQDLNLFEDNVLNENRLDEIFTIYENTFSIDAVDNLPDELYKFRKLIQNLYGTNPLFTGNYHTTTIDGEVGVREYIIKRVGSDWNNEKLRKEGFTIYETKISLGEKNE